MNKILTAGLLLTVALASCGQSPVDPTTNGEPAGSTAPTRPGAAEESGNQATAVDLLGTLSPEGITVSLKEYEQQRGTDGADEALFASIVRKNAATYPAKGQLAPQATYADIATQIHQLNATEKTLCNRSASECAAVLASGTVAHAAAANPSFTGWQSVTTNNERDAMRHGTWNAVMTIKIGYTKASEWANAHEYGNPNRIPGVIGEQMDFYNNSVGRNIGNETIANPQGMPFYLEEVATSNVRDAVKSGRMRVVSRAYASEAQASGNTLVASNTYRSQWPSNF